MCDKSTYKPYVSCIKIDGVPILPPLIRPEQRKELQKYKQQAIKLESRLKHLQELKASIDKLLCSEKYTERPLSTLTFSDTNSHIEALGISQNNIVRPTLSTELIDVSEYSTNGVKIIQDNESVLRKSLIETNSSHIDDTDTETLFDTRTRPKLIRSNSYTLDTPSPMLIAHLLENTNKLDSDVNTHIIPFEKSEFSSINTVCYNDNNIQEYSTANTVTIDKEGKEPDLLITDTNTQLMQLLQKIPEDYSSQIIELLKKQKLEEHNQYVDYPTPDNSEGKEYSPKMQMNDNSVMSMSPSQSIYCSASTTSNNTLTARSTRTVKLINLESDSGEKCSSIKSEEEVKNNESHSVNRELFPSQLDVAKFNSMRKEWAASVIGAYIRGYLTRRILKTEKVQTLIETIKDALICALQLHSGENIDETDVELHRRLIQQVTAACEAFHDIFFELTTSQQMQIIAVDRQRKKEKESRPTSATSARKTVQTSRSSSSHQMTPISTPEQSRSLTKV